MFKIQITFTLHATHTLPGREMCARALAVSLCSRALQNRVWKHVERAQNSMKL